MRKVSTSRGRATQAIARGRVRPGASYCSAHCRSTLRTATGTVRCEAAARTCSISSTKAPSKLMSLFWMPCKKWDGGPRVLAFSCYSAAARMRARARMRTCARYGMRACAGAHLHALAVDLGVRHIIVAVKSLISCAGVAGAQALCLVGAQRQWCSCTHSVSIPRCTARRMF